MTTTADPTFATLLLSLDQAMQRVANRCLAEGMSQADADACAHIALNNHLNDLLNG